MEILDALARAFRDAARSAVPRSMRPMPQHMSNYISQFSPEQDEREKLIYAMLCALAHAFEKAAGK